MGLAVFKATRQNFYEAKGKIGDVKIEWMNHRSREICFDVEVQ